MKANVQLKKGTVFCENMEGAYLISVLYCQMAPNKQPPSKTEHVVWG